MKKITFFIISIVFIACSKNSNDPIKIENGFALLSTNDYKEYSIKFTDSLYFDYYWYNHSDLFKVKSYKVDSLSIKNLKLTNNLFCKQLPIIYDGYFDKDSTFFLNDIVLNYGVKKLDNKNIETDLVGEWIVIDVTSKDGSFLKTDFCFCSNSAPYLVLGNSKNSTGHFLAGGMAGVNTFYTSYEYSKEDSTINFPGIWKHFVGCNDVTGNFEKHFLFTLQNVNEYEIKNNLLILKNKEKNYSITLRKRENYSYEAYKYIK